MKASRFNYIVPNGEKVIIFNELTEFFFEVPKEKVHIYTTIISNPDEYTKSFIPFILRMKNQGFVLDDEIDETELLDEKFRQVQSEDLYHIMILPTYQCNLRCWYCIQDHQNMWMSDEIVLQIKSLVQKKIEDPDIKKCRLSWFGGEPLLCYSKIIDLTSYIKNLCSKNNKTFICDITTNGTLLNRDLIRQLKDVGVTTYQITIDGDKLTHDSIKVLSKGSAYDKTLENINIITESTSCVLRFNYTHENLKPENIIKDLKAKINTDNRHNVTFLLYKVWQEAEDTINHNEVDTLVHLSSDMGLNPLMPTCNLCYADKKHFDCIFPNGKVEKCDNESPNSAHGLLSQGKIVWNGDTISHLPAYQNEFFPCRACKYLPICWGPCVARRGNMLKNKQSGLCMYSDKDSQMRQYIINRCANVKRSM
jgi:uncharacterized protein